MGSVRPTAFNRRVEATIVVTVLLLAFGLRVHELGSDSLWNDEAGQALAALQPTFKEMFEVERTHVMALPLDYLMTRIVAGLGVSETILRFPAAIWGTLTVALVYTVAKRFKGIVIASIGAYLLAISDVHVRYSQEVRFYASLTFFYGLASLVVIRAVQSERRRWWVVYIGCALIGAYFHPFVLLSLVNGYVHVLLKSRTLAVRRQLSRLVTSSAVLAVALMPAYWYFKHPRKSFELLQFNDSLFEALMQGMGWTPFWPLGALMITLFFAGIVGVARARGPMLSLLLGGAIQIPMVLAADWVSGYWFAGRQLLHLLPLALMTAAAGIRALSGFLAKKTGDRAPGRNQTKPTVASLVVVIIITVVSAPHVGEYYDWTKSDGRVISAWMAQMAEPEARIIIEPAHEDVIYRFYLEHVYGVNELANMFQPITGDMESDLRTTDRDQAVIVIATSKRAGEIVPQLAELGFVSVAIEGMGGAHRVYSRYQR